MLDSWEAWYTLAVLLALVVALARDLARPYLIFLVGLGALLVGGVLDAETAFAGLSNSAVIAIGSLFVVAAGVQETNALAFIDELIFPRSRRVGTVLGRMMPVTATMSALLNNTPIVAMLIPRVSEWAERNELPASKLMIPLSYAAILGGITTLIGTSTNLLVSGLLEASGHAPFTFFEITRVGLPVALLAIAAFALFGHRFLPARPGSSTTFDTELNACLFELRLTAGSPLAGLSVEEGDLRNLEDAFLAHVQRDSNLIAATPELVLQAGDRLIFQGSSATIDDLLRRPGLERAVTLNGEHASTLPLFEALIAPSSSLVGKTLRDVRFRDEYNGVVLGIHRRDASLETALGRTPLQAGDLLLIEAKADFDERWNSRRNEFYMVAPHRPRWHRPTSGKARVALAILLGVVLAATLGWTDIATSAFLGALATVGTGCLSVRHAREAIDLPVLIVIASALGLGAAIETTGLARVIADNLISFTRPFGAVALLAGIYVATNLLTELITNAGSAALMLSIGIVAAQEVGAPIDAFAVTVAIAASASFMTPIGYQTNLMVMSPGGYRFSDYVRAGVLMNLLVFAATVTVVTLTYGL